MNVRIVNVAPQPLIKNGVGYIKKKVRIIMSELEKKTNKQIIIEDYKWLIELIFELISSGDIEVENYALDELPDRFVRDISEMLKLKDNATTLLSKLKVLGRDSVDKIITKLIRKLNTIDNGICDQVTGKPLTDYVINKQNAIDIAINQICELIPKEEVVIAEGRVKAGYGVVCMEVLGAIRENVYTEKVYVYDCKEPTNPLRKFDGKKGKLIFIEDNK